MAESFEHRLSRQRKHNDRIHRYLETPLYLTNRAALISSLFVGGAIGIYALVAHPDFLATLTFHKINALNALNPVDYGMQSFVPAASKWSTYIGPLGYTMGSAAVAALTYGGIGLVQNNLKKWNENFYRENIVQY